MFGSQKRDTFRTPWEAAVDRAQLANFRFHDLRHTFASCLVQRGRSLKVVQEALGHRTISEHNRGLLQVLSPHFRFES